jgi:hypothetical protein
MFVVPPIPNEGVLKYKISRVRYENLCEMENAVIDCDKGMFQVLTKRIFPIEPDNAAFIVADVLKIRKE